MKRLLGLLYLLVGVTVAVSATPVPKGWKRCNMGLPGQASIDFPGPYSRSVRGENVYYSYEDKSAYYLVGVEIDESVMTPETYPDFTREKNPASAAAKGWNHGVNTSFRGGQRVGYFLAVFGLWRAALVKYSGQTAASFKFIDSKMIRMNGWKGEAQTFACPPATGRVRLLTNGATAVQVVVLEQGPASKKADQFLQSLHLPEK